MDLLCIHSPDIFFAGGNILCETPQKIRGLDDYMYGVYMYVCMYVCMYVGRYVCMYVGMYVQ